MLPSIDELNAMEAGRAATALGALFENAPRFARRVVTRRPFGSYDELIDRAEELARSLPEHDRIEVIDGHPRIGADPGSVSTLSYREQGYDRGSGTGENELAERLVRLNDRYEDRFGFRFCVFVAGRPRSTIADVLERRLEATREEELERGLSDVFAIARSRLVKLTQPPEEAR